MTDAERDRAMRALQHVRHALIAAIAGAPVKPPLHCAEEELLRILFTEEEVQEYLASDFGRLYGRSS